MQLRVVALVLTSLSLSAASLATSFAGTYTSLRKDNEGILVGYEIALEMTSNGQFQAKVRCAYGNAGKRTTLRATVNGNKLELAENTTDENLCPDGKFVGTIDFQQITGQFQDPAQLPSNWITERLKRVPSRQ